MRHISGHKGAVNAVAFSPDGRLMATGGDDYLIQLWEPGAGAWKRTKHGTMPVSAIAFHPSETCLVFGCHAVFSAWNAVQPYGWSGSSPLNLIAPRALFACRTTSLHFSPTGETLVACARPAGRGPDPAVGVALSWRFSRGDAGWSTPDPVVHHFEDLDIRAVAVSARDGHAVLGTDRGLWVLALNRDAKPVPWPVPDLGAVDVLAMAPDRDRLAVGAGGRVAVVPFSLKDAARHWSRPAHDAVAALAFSPDGRAVLSGGADGAVAVWGADGGAERQRLDFGLGAVRGVAVAPDGLTAAACGDRGVVVFDLG